MSWFINNFKYKKVTMESLANKIENLIDSSKYNEACDLFCKETGLKIKVSYFDYNYFFTGDRDQRSIYKITLKANNKQYTFKFGQSIANTGIEPSVYDILSVLTKREPGYLEDFCNDFGYDPYNKESEKLYLRVCKEWNSLNRIFTSEQLEALVEIR